MPDERGSGESLVLGPPVDRDLGSAMAYWLYFVHPPRPDFVATITPDEAAIMQGPHSDYLQSLFDDGRLVLAGPTTGGTLDDGLTLLEADDEDEARAVMDADPAITSGLMTGELRMMRVAFLRGRDGPAG